MSTFTIRHILHTIILPGFAFVKRRVTKEKTTVYKEELDVFIMKTSVKDVKERETIYPSPFFTEAQTLTAP